MSADRLKGKKDVLPIDNSHKKAPLKLYHWSLGGWTLKDPTLGEISQRKTTAFNVTCRKNLKRDTKELTYNPERDSENSNTEGSSEKK